MWRSVSLFYNVCVCCSVYCIVVVIVYNEL